MQFIQEKPANNVLLTGARGTGKSSLIKAILNTYTPQGLRLIEVDKADLTDLRHRRGGDSTCRNDSSLQMT